MIYIIDLIMEHIYMRIPVGKWSGYLYIFSSPDPKGQMSYCHHLASVFVVRRPSYVVNFFKNLVLWKY